MIDKAVIAAATYFNDNQRKGLKHAGEMAGLQVVQIVDEPVAASIAYSVDRVQEHTIFLVFDFGA